MPNKHAKLWPSRQGQPSAKAVSEAEPVAPTPAEPPPAVDAGPARRFCYTQQSGNFQRDLNLTDGSADLAAVLARLDYAPIGGPPFPGWRLFRQVPLEPGRKTRGLYAAVSDTDGSAQVVLFLPDQAAFIAFLRDFAPLFPLLPDLWHLQHGGVPIIP